MFGIYSGTLHFLDIPQHLLIASRMQRRIRLKYQTNKCSHRREEKHSHGCGQVHINQDNINIGGKLRSEKQESTLNSTYNSLKSEPGGRFGNKSQQGGQLSVIFYIFFTKSNFQCEYFLFAFNRLLH